MALAIRDLSFRYGAAPVLERLSTGALPRGEFTALVGPNGAGKSTLFRCAAGLLKPQLGSATLDGADLAPLTSRERARKIFYLSQDTQARVALSVFDIILLARKSLHRGFALAASADDMRAVEAVIAELGLGPFASRDIGTLSGGQRQLAAIGQALVREPDVLLLDEPTSALDVRRQLDVMATIREATRRRHIVTITAIHDLSLAARFADRVLVMNEGRIAQAGPPAEVLAHSAVSETYAVGVHLERSARGTLLVEPYIQVD
ncbi:ABC transporter ATP-binding protein [Bosea sp. SSUT16]|uniref:ABC transporter ATP-binding protein n=1 Tax=Bosea spartocytisi TaxID=2773451 RepID=A0A927I267_9HYPH|nr:ABC transporter ATP-binding protein [Bosea spartocytisi]MBD3847258.1 ABC transporter ATP-binding protein [Bosea spartocytisi]MCT4474047.1 ABC transporter ATP-binding protein [Bosea spartocytisi]